MLDCQMIIQISFAVEFLATLGAFEHHFLGVNCIHMHIKIALAGEGL